MTNEIAAYMPPAQPEIDYTWNLANKLCKTEFVPSNLRNKPEAVLAVFLTGRELGIGPMQSLRDIYPVNGRPALMATLMVNRVRALGHRFKTVRSTDQEAVVQIHRHEQPDPEPEIRWTQADAKRAGLLGKEVWQKYPTAMLWARAASAACRRDAAEALGGAVYTPEEIEDGQGATTATWGTPEGSGAVEQPGMVGGGEPPDAPAPADQSGEGASSPVPSPAQQSEGRAARTVDTPGQRGRHSGRPSGADASAAGASDTGVDRTAGQEPPDVEAQTAGAAAHAEAGETTGQAGSSTREGTAAAPADRSGRKRRGEPEQGSLGGDDPGRFAR